MFDAFRGFESWSDKVTDFWTFGPADSVGTFVLTALGMLLMVVSFIGFVWLEHRKVTEQARRLREMGMPVPGEGGGSSQTGGS
jgi:hypothetical protein